MAGQAFAVGVRIEHPQALVNEAQYGPPLVIRLSARRTTSWR